MKPDLTVIFITANKIPPHWEAYQMGILLRAIEGYPIISISREPMPIGKNLIDTEEMGYTNIYRQMLRGAIEAETPFVAIAEDDTLYNTEHFSFYRPPLDTFAYNQNKWSLFTWDDSVFSLKRRKSNCTLIAPRDLLIEALEERFARWPNGDFPMAFMGECGRPNVERGLDITLRKSIEVYSKHSVIQVSHPEGTEDRQKRKRKAHGQIRAIEIPDWGRPADINKHYL